MILLFPNLNCLWVLAKGLWLNYKHNWKHLDLQVHFDFWNLSFQNRKPSWWHTLEFRWISLTTQCTLKLDIYIKQIWTNFVLFSCSCYKHYYSVFYYNIRWVFTYLHIYIGLFVNIVLYIHSGLGLWHYYSWSDHSFHQSRVDGFTLWWFLYLNLSAAESAFPFRVCISSYWQGPKCSGVGCAIQAEVSLTAMACQTYPEPSLYLAGALVNTNILTCLFCRLSLYISVGQWMPRKQVWWHSMQ